MRSAFGFPIAQLQSYSRRFDLALMDETVGAEVRKHLPPDFPQRFAERMARLGELQVLRSAAHGRAGELTLAKQDALGDVVLLSGSARAAARVFFADNPAVLHGEFFVGGNRSKSVATTIRNAQLLAASCMTYADALLPYGWSALETALLSTTIEGLKKADTDHETATNLKEGYTAEQTAVANDLYRMCRAMQNVARVVYPKSRVAADPSLVAGRAKFMLGEFPPQPGVKPDLPDTPSPETVPSAPTGTIASAAEASGIAVAPNGTVPVPEPTTGAAPAPIAILAADDGRAHAPALAADAPLQDRAPANPPEIVHASACLLRTTRDANRFS